jgi:hypothetical protein
MYTAPRKQHEDGTIYVVIQGAVNSVAPVRGHTICFFSFLKVYSSRHGSCSLEIARERLDAVTTSMRRTAVLVQVRYSLDSWWMKRPSKSPHALRHAPKTEHMNLCLHNCLLVHPYHSIRRLR